MPEVQETRLKDIYICLKNAKFDTYFVGQHKGDCISPYVVIKQGVSTKYDNLSTNVQYYDILIYVPQNNPSKIEVLLDEVEQAMKALYPMIKSQNSRTEMFFDDSVKGWMRSTLYSNYRKIDY